MRDGRIQARSTRNRLPKEIRLKDVLIGISAIVFNEERLNDLVRHSRTPSMDLDSTRKGS
jgi:hypothetical protein